MSEENSNLKQQSTELSSGVNVTNETVYNTLENEDGNEGGHDEDEMKEFNSWSKKYNFIAKEIRKNAIEQEKQELENLKNVPMANYKYFEGTKQDRIIHLDEEKRLLEEMENLAKEKRTKKKTKVVRDKSAARDRDANKLEDEKEDPNFKKMRKEYHEMSKEMRKKSLQLEKNELKLQQQEKSLDYVPGSPRDRERTIGREVIGLEKTERLKAEKEKAAEKKVKKEKR